MNLFIAWTPQIAAVILGGVIAGSLIVGLSGKPAGARQRRHAFHIRQARKALDRLSRIPRPAQQIAYLRKIDPLTFEELLLEAAQRRGHKIHRNHRYTGDGGMDGSIEIAGRVVLLQAKRYGGHINKAHLTDFCRLVDDRQCQGLFIHTGRTGKGARALLTSDQVNIISGQRLLDFLGI